ncbi:plastocyanin/azurin family copper-binding protein [Haloarcula salinisoli]|uniref:Halocyanin n=2 Tax=Haloarcula TaxID=2237 RepID=A0A8J8C9F0_9EURY|nr:plastocyanin/azurin family copper-binding protein [Halomicroarcula salinisoli]MBX0288773.1 halocyanin [Halomicroarcula salinisoli]MBX0305546.1 halocyanin [Halomicroarcula salinisoli]
MERRRILKTAGFLATGGVTSLAGCSSSGNGDGGGEPTTTETQETAGGSGGSNTVMMVTEGSEYYFDPLGLFIDSGETVTFEIQSGSHSATAYKQGTSSAEVTRIPEGAETFNSEILSEQGATFEHTFETTGTYDYFCIPHKSLGMVGRIVVGEPGGPAEGSMPPDGDVPESQTIVDQGSVSYSSFSG